MSLLKKYLFTTFSITYLSWGIIAVYTQMNNIPFGSSIILYLLYILGVIGPAIAGIIVSKNTDSKKDFRMFLKSCYQPPKKLTWYIFIILIVLIFSLLPYFISGGEQIVSAQYILLQIPLFILIGGLEEIGWRGFMLRELTKRIPAFTSTLLVSIVWIIWHLPLFFIIGTYQNEYLNIPEFSLSVISFSLLLSTVYYKTKSIFLCIMTHALCNSVLNVFVSNQSLLAGIIALLFSLFIYLLFATNRKQSIMTKVDTYTK
ncbi:CPBP family intramembrane glutamic endopeptidase [Bacillus sp. 1P06AnD]|uniref:CPBP family intramembrane glutamic endopeptidase n=1 Tax=Bacillus sp. 1P06AnD TaxID=3132208 RepID=UPI00399FE1B9